MSPEEAELYSLVHDGAPGDVDFYARFCEGGASVLELGSGTGRMSRALVDRGFAVVGLESDPGMLEVARREAREGLRYVEGDMTGFELADRFDRVVLPFTGLYCLMTAEALDACLAAVARHLTPEGLFAFDAYCADGFHAESRPEDYPADRLEKVAEIEHDGAPLTVYESSSWDRDAQTMSAEYVYRRPNGSKAAEIQIGHRYVLSPQLAPALSRAGLSLLGLYGGFSGEPFDPRGGSMIVVAELASADAAP